ncbi:unnamed protein product [Dicrocoelium dendriticum]|nr:unnamed protein product [Dicrocoelium dendriticum]
MYPALAAPYCATYLIQSNSFNSPCVESYGMMLINLRSITHKVHRIGPFILLSYPQLVLIPETRHHSNDFDSLLCGPGYTTFCNGQDNRRGGGGLIYVREDSGAPDFELLSIGDPEDSIWIQTTGGLLDLHITCVYNPQHTSSEKINKLIKLFTEISLMPPRHKIGGGDFNMPLIPLNDQVAPLRYRGFVYTVHANNWTQQVQDHSRLSNPLDLIFTQGVSDAVAGLLDNIHGCEHKVVKLIFKLSSPYCATSSSVKQFQMFNRINWGNFVLLARSVNWDNFFLATDVDAAAYVLYLNHFSCRDVLTPLTCSSRLKMTAESAKAYGVLREMKNCAIDTPTLRNSTSLLA